MALSKRESCSQTIGIYMPHLRRPSHGTRRQVPGWARQLRAGLQQLDALGLDTDAQAQVTNALQNFRDFGAERWVAATANLLLAVNSILSSDIAASLPPAYMAAGTAKLALPALPRSTRPLSLKARASRWPCMVGSEADCKTVIRRFESGPHLRNAGTKRPGVVYWGCRSAA